MPPYVLSPEARIRALRRRGGALAPRPIPAERAALLVIDMQNHFVAPGGVGEVPPARKIVPTINGLAHGARAMGCAVVWIQTTAKGAITRWPLQHSHMLAPGDARRRLESLAPGARGFDLYPGLEAHRSDLRVTKIHYSAFIPGSSRLDERLRARGIDTLLIAGTATNVCCDSTARDAMMLNYRPIMLSDATATWSEAEHAATLDLFVQFFGDVMTAADALRNMVPPPGRN